MRPLARVFVVLAGVFAAACVPESDTFLSEPGAQPLDSRVAGIWFARDPNDREIITLSISQNEDNKYAITWVMVLPSQELTKTEKPVAWVQYTGHTTKLDGKTYMNMVLAHSAWPHNVPKRMIMRYWLAENGELRFSFMNDSAAKKAIKSGDLKGTQPKDGFVRISSDRNALIAFIRKIGPDKAFRRPSKPMRRMPKYRG